MFEETLGKVGNKKKSYDVSAPTIPEKIDIEESGPKKTGRCFLGLRHAVTLVGFLSCFLQNANRLVLGVGIVAMVKHGQAEVTSQKNRSETSCPLPSSPPKLTAGSSFQGEFDWSPELQGYLLGIGFLSFLLTQTPGGRLVDAVGSKTLLVSSIAATGVCTLVSPFAARCHLYVLIALHFIRGAAQGVTTPAIYKMMSHWIPRDDRGTLSTLMMCGYGAGAAVSGIVTGWLCDVPGLGWPSAFYVWGAVTVLISVVFHFIHYEHPDNHPWITKEELNYITEGLETKVSGKQPPTPWKKMFSSVATYAYIYGLFGHYWTDAYYLTVHPTFMGTILHYPMTENGVTSCLPVLLKSAGGLLASVMSYWISKKNLIGLNKLRKISTVFGAFGFSLCMLGMLAAGCDAIINILCFALSLFASGIALSGIMISGVDMAPRFAGSLVGVASAIAGSSCVLIPVITGLITTHETLSEWRIVFWINLVVVGSSGLVYLLFGSAEVQPWNYTDLTEEEKKPNKNDN